MNLNQKIKDLKVTKKKLLKEKKEVAKTLEIIRDEKKALQKKIKIQKDLWKINLTKSQEIDDKISEISKLLKEKKTKGKRGFRLSGLSIDIKNALNQKIIDFFNLHDSKVITRIMVMKNLFEYIEKNNLHTEGDRRYLDLEKNVDELLNVYQINKNDHDTKLRIQKFRFYLEKNIKKD